MIESLEQLRKDADERTAIASGEDGFKTVWMMRSDFLKDLDARFKEER